MTAVEVWGGDNSDHAPEVSHNVGNESVLYVTVNETDRQCASVVSSGDRRAWIRFPGGAGIGLLM